MFLAKFHDGLWRNKIASIVCYETESLKVKKQNKYFEVLDMFTILGVIKEDLNTVSEYLKFRLIQFFLSQYQDSGDLRLHTKIC